MTVKAFMLIALGQRSIVFGLGQIMDSREPCRVQDCDTLTNIVLLVWRFIGGM